MLTQIRERATGWIAWVVVILISIPFALWGIQSYFGDPAAAAVATVESEEITAYAYQNRLARQRQAMIQRFGGDVNPALMRGMEEQVLESMISTRLLDQYARSHGFRVSDEQLRQRIESSESFQRDGIFDPTLYRDLLRANGFTLQTYESGERSSAAVDQLQTAIADSAFATRAEVTQLLALQEQTRNVDYIILAAADYREQVTVDEDEAREYYQSHLADYEAVARIKVDYIDLSVESLSAAIEPTEEEIVATYTDTRERYRQAEVRKASHILFSVDDAASEEEDAAVLAEAEAVLAEAEGDADFAELAREHSDDPGSKEQGGDLGVVTRGQMVPPFEEAVFDMTQDEIRGPIKTRFGYHIIRLTELGEERQKTLDEVRDEVSETVRQTRGEERFSEVGETFQNLVFETPESLEIAATDLDLEILQTDWFTESEGEGMAAEAAVRRAAFSEDVVTEDLNSNAIELGFDRLVAVHKADYEAAHQRPFEEVSEEIIELLTENKASAAAQTRGEEWLAELRAAAAGDAVDTATDDTVAEAEDDAADTTEEDAVTEAEDDAADTTEEDAVTETEDDAADTTEDDTVAATDDDAADTTEEDAVAEAEDDTADTATAALDPDLAPWDALVQRDELEAQTLAERRDDVSGNLTELGEDAFSQAPPDDHPGYYGIPMANGDYALYTLKEVTPGNGEDADPAVRDRMADSLLNRDGEEFYEQLLKTLRDTADVTINREALEAPILY